MSKFYLSQRSDPVRYYYSSQSEHGSNGNEGVLRIPRKFGIILASPSHCLVSYPGHSLGQGSYPSAEMQSLYSAPPADWAHGRQQWQLDTSLWKHHVFLKCYCFIWWFKAEIWTNFEDQEPIIGLMGASYGHGTQNENFNSRICVGHNAVQSWPVHLQNIHVVLRRMRSRSVDGLVSFQFLKTNN